MGYTVFAVIPLKLSNRNLQEGMLETASNATVAQCQHNGQLLKPNFP